MLGNILLHLRKRSKNVYSLIHRMTKKVIASNLKSMDEALKLSESFTDIGIPSEIIKSEYLKNLIHREYEPDCARR